MPQETLKTALTDTITTIQKNPSKGKVVFRASSCLDDGVRCSVRVREFEPLVIDEPEVLGGTDAGMNPVELVLGALGTCQQIMYAAYASVMGIQFDELSVECRGNLDLRGLFGLDSSVRPGYSEVRFETRITSAEPVERIRELAEAVESHCPVLDIMVRPTPVRGKVVLNGEPVHQQEWI